MYISISLSGELYKGEFTVRWASQEELNKRNIMSFFNVRNDERNLLDTDLRRAKIYFEEKNPGPLASSPVPC